MLRLLILTLGLAGSLLAQEPQAPAPASPPLDLRLPTENHHLFTGQLDKFYMYVDRNFEGEASQPWEAGSYGLVRTPIRLGNEVLLTKFHEGIDIAPIKRDRAGNPLDLVSSIADGTVAHVSPLAGRSNYGKYVVIEHRWENSSVYSLYAHLSDILCKPGDPVKAGSVIGRMGFTGAGINRVRAHCHLELCLLMNSGYEEWHKLNGGGVNYQGLFNGMNLIGCEIARFFLEHRQNPHITFSQFVTRTPAYFKVTFPSQGTPDLVKRYPWLNPTGNQEGNSWEIGFTPVGFPVSCVPSTRTVSEPIVTAVRPSAVPHRYLTRGLVTGEGNQASLTAGGKKLVSLLTGDFPGAGTRPAATADSADTSE
ncbi:MAG: M23 family metallopeptidase [Luteolibacter sp.]